jgi:hypothetical protein
MVILDIIKFLTWMLIGHVIAATILYFNHRFVFHGRLGLLPLFKDIKKLHTLHHLHSFSDKVIESMNTPLWGRLLLGSFFIGAAVIITPAFGFGMLSFAGVYAYRHKLSHTGDTSYFALHHLHHHKNANVNFAGVYPIFDKIFLTHEDY